MSLQDLAPILTAIGAIATAIVTGITLAIKIKDRRPTFNDFKRIREKDIWKIFVHSPTKPLRKCNVLFDRKPLPESTSKSHERGVGLGGGLNFDMPIGTPDDDERDVIVREDKTIIFKKKFKDVPT